MLNRSPMGMSSPKQVRFGPESITKSFSSPSNQRPTQDNKTSFLKNDSKPDPKMILMQNDFKGMWKSYTSNVRHDIQSNKN